MSLPLHVDEPVGPRIDPALRQLFHRLNNQLSVVLAHAELLESKAGNDIERSRASQVVASVLDTLGTTKLIQHRTNLIDSDP